MLNRLITNIPDHITREVSTLDLDIEVPGHNEDINRLLQETVLNGGKRLRPLLLFLMGDLFNLKVIF